MIRMARVAILPVGLVVVLVYARLCAVVPVGALAYGCSESWGMRLYWWLWPSAWMVFALSYTMSRYYRSSLVSALGNLAVTFGLSVLIRVLMLVPVTYLLRGDISRLPSLANNKPLGLYPELLLLRGSPSVPYATVVVAVLLGALSMPLFWLALRIVLGNRGKWRLAVIIAAHTVTQQLAAYAGGAVLIPVSVLTMVLLMPIVESMDHREMEKLSHTEGMLPRDDLAD